MDGADQLSLYIKALEFSIVIALIYLLSKFWLRARLSSSRNESLNKFPFIVTWKSALKIYVVILLQTLVMVDLYFWLIDSFSAEKNGILFITFASLVYMSTEMTVNTWLLNRKRFYFKNLVYALSVFICQLEVAYMLWWCIRDFREIDYVGIIILGIFAGAFVLMVSMVTSYVLVLSEISAEDKTGGIRNDAANDNN